MIKNSFYFGSIAVAVWASGAGAAQERAGEQTPVQTATPCELPAARQ